ncbi:DUF1684 domain-containing protein [Cryobacterium frigoriphilum]|uniref:DUF1684 domain-containing protein n=1 Tax=Cryobacterium frigoriphilum TaxID=1259150 RepID=UPI001F544D43|nr:DUF1684 domain-containing protein [Cryobacterium frigoriphilum]
MTPEGLLAAVRRRRADAVIAAQGNLALANTQWITGDVAASQPIWGVPGLWSPLSGGVSGLRVVASAADGIVVDGVLVDGEALPAGMDCATPSRIRFSDTVTGTVIASEEGDYALRVWDADSPGIRDFGSIEAFAYDPAWVVAGHYTPNVGADAISIAHIAEAGKTREQTVPGQIRVTLDGRDHRLVAFEDGTSVLLVFADATTGVTSYSVGRFLRVVPSETGAVTLDFNRAYLPPCAFSYNFNCPIPPAENRLDFAIEAGERNVLNANGDPLH